MDAGVLQAGITLDSLLDVLHDLLILPIDPISYLPRHHRQLIVHVPCALDGSRDLPSRLLLGLAVHLPAEFDHALLGRDVDIRAADPFVREQGQLGLEGEPGVRDLPGGGFACVLDRALGGGHRAAGRPLGDEPGSREDPQTQHQHRNHRFPCHACLPFSITLLKRNPVPAPPFPGCSTDVRANDSRVPWRSLGPRPAPRYSPRRNLAAVGAQRASACPRRGPTRIVHAWGIGDALGRPAL